MQVRCQMAGQAGHCRPSARRRKAYLDFWRGHEKDKGEAPALSIGLDCESGTI
jgi:hypothetical protein